MKKIIALTLLVTSLLTLGQAEDKLTMTTIDGNKLHMVKTPGGLTFDEYKGKILFIEIYGHRCSYCIKAINPYNTLQEKYKDELAIVSVEIGGLDDNQLKAFDKKYGINYINLSKQEAGELVPYITQKGGYRGMIPFLVILDQKGDIFLTRSGPISKNELEDAIKKLSK